MLIGELKYGKVVYYFIVFYKCFFSGMGTTVASIMKDFCDEIDQLFAEVERRLAEVRDNPDQYDMTDVVRFPTLHDDELDYNFRSNENQSSRDDNVCLESKIEDDYDSDCSLGSLNSLYLSLEKKYDRFQDLNNTDGANRTQLENQNGHGSESTRTPGNDLIATEHIAIDTAMFYNKIKKENPTTELNASDYYGKQVIIYFKNEIKKKKCIIYCKFM